MVKIYLTWIRAGKMSVEDVPERWNNDVKAAIERG